MTRDEAIAACRRMQESHILWFDWLGVRDESPQVLEIAGTREDHEQLIADYEGIIAVLETAP